MHYLLNTSTELEYRLLVKLTCTMPGISCTVYPVQGPLCPAHVYAGRPVTSPCIHPSIHDSTLWSTLCKHTDLAAYSVVIRASSTVRSHQAVLCSCRAGQACAGYPKQLTCRDMQWLKHSRVKLLRAPRDCGRP